MQSAARSSQVAARVYCPHCCENVEAQVTFSYGEPGAFKLGDRVRGSGAVRVVADASVEGPCPACDWLGAWPVEVWLENDMIASINPPSRRFNWVAAGSFIQLA